MNNFVGLHIKTVQKAVQAYRRWQESSGGGVSFQNMEHACADLGFELMLMLNAPEVQAARKPSTRAKKVTKRAGRKGK
jgi:hypothetical protein